VEKAKFSTGDHRAEWL